MRAGRLNAMRRILLALYFLVFAGMAQAQDLQAIPALSGRVTDLTATLSADQRGQLEARLAAFEQSKGAQIAVLLVATVKPETIEQYALRVVEAWKLGRKGVDDGVLLLIAREDRKLRFEVGYGWRVRLTMQRPGASSARRSHHVSNRAIFSAALTAGLKRRSRSFPARACQVRKKHRGSLACLLAACGTTWKRYSSVALFWCSSSAASCAVFSGASWGPGSLACSPD